MTVFECYHCEKWRCSCCDGGLEHPRIEDERVCKDCYDEIMVTCRLCGGQGCNVCLMLEM
jgi:hypothetical protein